MPWWSTPSSSKNDVWDIVPRSEGKSIVSSKWLYKIKHAAEAALRSSRRGERVIPERGSGL